MVSCMFHQTPAGLDEALLHIGQRPAVDALRQHQSSPRFEVPAVRAAFLLSVHWALAGIHVEHDAVGRIQRLGLCEHIAVHGHQPHEILLTSQQLGLEPMH